MQKVSQGSLSAQVYNALRTALIDGEFEPDQRLKMQDLAEELGSSVTPVREACLRLVSERALELRSGRFVAVPPLTRDRYNQLRTIRVALERLATKLGAERATPQDVEALRRIHEAFVAAEAKGDASEARRQNQYFHFHLYGLCGMDMLTSQIEGLWASMGPILNVYYRHLEHDYEGAEEHLGILDALARNDGEAAADALERDMIRGGRCIMAIFDDDSDREIA